MAAAAGVWFTLLLTRAVLQVAGEWISTTLTVVVWLWMIAAAVPVTTTTIRRLHDRGWGEGIVWATWAAVLVPALANLAFGSGAAFSLIVTIVGGLFTLVAVGVIVTQGCLPGLSGTTQYGPPAHRAHEVAAAERGPSQEWDSTARSVGLPQSVPAPSPAEIALAVEDDNEVLAGRGADVGPGFGGTPAA